MTIADIINAINDYAPLNLQESWDNSGLQVGDPNANCTGVLLCVDVSPAILQEAIARKCNLVVSHHPLIFKGLKHICPTESKVQQSVYAAIKGGITIFSSHTALDSASEGISREMAKMIGANPLHPLQPGADAATGLGCIAEFAQPVSCNDFIKILKSAFNINMIRGSWQSRAIKRIGLCGGSGGEFIPKAIKEGCDAFLTADVRYHDFVDYGEDIFIADIGHFESEECSKQIFYRIISEKFPNFAVYKSEIEKNPIIYI